MSQHQRRGATPFVILLLALGLALALAGVSPGHESQATAAPTVSLRPPATPGLSVTIVSPLDGFSMVPPDTSVIIGFNMQIEASTLNSSTFYLQKAGSSSKVAADISLAYTKYGPLNRYGLYPTNDLLPSTKYQVTITSGVKGLGGGRTLSNPKTWSFTTGPFPHVVCLTPASGATGVPLDSVISASFDTGMDGSTLTQSNFYLTESGDSGHLYAEVTYDAATRTATLDPLFGLDSGSSYTVTLARGAKSASHASLEGAPVTWSFSTAAVATVSAQVPAGGAVNVPVEQEISVVFDRMMDASTITAASFSVRKVEGNSVPASVAYDPVTRTATLTPINSLEAGTAYEVTILGTVKGADGRALQKAPVRWTFRTTGGGGGAVSDVANSPYAAAIYELVDRGVITGFNDGTFRPDDSVSRQQFAKMIVMTLGYAITGAETCPFTDVAAQAGTDPLYPSKYVAVCASHGVTTGKTASTFAPYDPISHQQLITMLVRAGSLSDPPTAFVSTVTAGQFSQDEHYLNAGKAQYAGLLDGLRGVGPSYNFFAAATRGECAQLLYNLIGVLDK